MSEAGKGRGPWLTWWRVALLVVVGGALVWAALAVRDYEGKVQQTIGGQR